MTPPTSWKKSVSFLSLNLQKQEPLVRGGLGSLGDAPEFFDKVGRKHREEEEVQILSHLSVHPTQCRSSVIWDTMSGLNRATEHNSLGSFLVPV